MTYPKRLIEVDFPLKKVSYESRREKNIRSGHIKNLHIWWARRPLTACRAVLACSLWPDPVDVRCTQLFIENVSKELLSFIHNNISKISSENIVLFSKANEREGLLRNRQFLREALIGFVAEFSSFENGRDFAFIRTANNISKASAIELQTGEDYFTVVDPFSGGGAIPVESYRLGCTTYANDLNPIPVILNTLLIKILPKYGNDFHEHLKKAGESLYKIVSKELIEFFPTDEDGFEPIAYFRARTIICEGPNCGFRIPMIKKYGLSERNGYTCIIPSSNEEKRIIEFELYQGKKAHKLQREGTVKRGKVICPHCGYTHQSTSVKRQLGSRGGGANDAQMFAVILRHPKSNKRKFRVPSQKDLLLIEKAEKYINSNSIIRPEDAFSVMSGVFNAPIYGMNQWYKLYTHRQLIALNLFFGNINNAVEVLALKSIDERKYISICLGLIIGNLMHYNTSVSTYTLDHMLSAFIQGQAIPMKWDYAEANPLVKDLVGGFDYALNGFIDSLKGDISFTYEFNKPSAEVFNADAIELPLPENSIDCVFTDPPYYNSVPYADLSDLFLAWYKLFLKDYHPDLFSSLSEKDKELCVMSGWDPERYSNRDERFYTEGMRKAFTKAREICKPNGIIAIVFAHKSTSAWESLLSSVINAGLICIGSWPIDTERASRMRANKSAVLGSSIHIICRPREDENGNLIMNHVGDWREVQTELPQRIHEWMPRLNSEGVVGADAIFACLGPALEIFSRYSRVEKPNGEAVTLRAYLEKVWAVVSQEAINMVFSGGEAGNFEEDARLTAMWLWTLRTSVKDYRNEEHGEEDEDYDEEISSSSSRSAGYALEFDTARKIAQGLGANLEELKSVVEVKGDVACLIPVIERTSEIFGVAKMQPQSIKKKKKAQLTLSFENTDQEENIKYEVPEFQIEHIGKTVLDRLHQAMLLFSSGRTEALKRFLIEDGVGKDDRFWKLAQALTSLYPHDTDERRWVEAVQTYKKNLGF